MSRREALLFCGVLRRLRRLFALEAHPLGNAYIDGIAAAVVPACSETDGLGVIVCPLGIRLALLLGSSIGGDVCGELGLLVNSDPVDVPVGAAIAKAIVVTGSNAGPLSRVTRTGGLLRQSEGQCCARP